MARERKGSIKVRKDGSIWARVTFMDDAGKRREMMRRAETRTEARKIIKHLMCDLLFLNRRPVHPNQAAGDRVGD